MPLSQQDAFEAIYNRPNRGKNIQVSMPLSQQDAFEEAQLQALLTANGVSMPLSQQDAFEE